MLINFKAENYRSFKDEFSFSMVPAPKQKELEYSILTKKIKNTIYKSLCSSVIYGPNAAGKTNIIGAMDTFKKIIKRGNILDEKINKDSNIASYNLNLIPNNSLKKQQPTGFSIKFEAMDLIFQYDLKFNLGTFFEDEKYLRKITHESLYINEENIFKRDLTELEFADENTLKKYKKYFSLTNFELRCHIAKTTLIDADLFLTSGFKTIFAPKFVEIITQWLENNFLVIYDSNIYETVGMPLNKDNGSIKLHKKINNFARHIGINSNMVCYLESNETHKTELYSVFSNKELAIKANAVESYGTIRLINMLFPMLHALSNGSTLIIDEFDTSLHPMVVMNIINIFHNNEINKKNAQLIFNTHNPIFLNSNLFRRDEIKFVERENDKFSVLYSLSDFGTAGKSSARKTNDYMKNYFINRYGAIKDIDFTPYFREILNNPRIKIQKSKAVDK